MSETTRTHFVQIWTKTGHRATAYQLLKEVKIAENQPFRCSKFAPHDGVLMLDDVVVTDKTTMLYFTKDLGTVIAAHRA